MSSQKTYQLIFIRIMKKTLYITLTFSLVSVALVLFAQRYMEPKSVLEQQQVESAVLDVVAEDPRFATYQIDGKKITLTDGLHEEEAAPGSASVVRTQVFGEMLFGDVNTDGKSDAVFFLVQETGGTGVFYYMVAALGVEGGFRGTNAVFLGDRIAPQNIRIKNGVVAANYTTRPEGASFAERASVGRTLYAMVHNSGDLEEIVISNEGEQLMYGYITIGHEVREFRKCDTGEAFWIDGASPAYQEIVDTYNSFEVQTPYTPIFGIITAEVVGAPQTGFGADYSFAVSASSVVSILPSGNCKSDIIRVEDPQPGDVIESPLSLSGVARGTWFFEGSAPVVLTDWDGKIIAEGYVSTLDDWMTEKLVPFEGVLEFEKPEYGERGTLIFQKDNPSGLPEYDDALEFNISFGGE